MQGEQETRWTRTKENAQSSAPRSRTTLSRVSTSWAATGETILQTGVYVIIEISLARLDSAQSAETVSRTPQSHPDRDSRSTAYWHRVFWRRRS
jgi:hypothetical protein